MDTEEAKEIVDSSLPYFKKILEDKRCVARSLTECYLSWMFDNINAELPYSLDEIIQAYRILAPQFFNDSIIIEEPKKSLIELRAEEKKQRTQRIKDAKTRRGIKISYRF